MNKKITEQITFIANQIEQTTKMTEENCKLIYGLSKDECLINLSKALKEIVK